MKLLNKKLARTLTGAAMVAGAAVLLSTGAFAAEAPASTTRQTELGTVTEYAPQDDAAVSGDGTVAGYLPPQEQMVQGDIALHSGDQQTADPTYGGYGAPEGNPIQGDVMLISSDLTTTLPSDTLVEKSEAHYTVKGLLGKQVLYTARQEGRVLTISVPENVATFRTTVLDLQTLMNNGVSTVVLTTNKTSTTLNLTLLTEGYSANAKVVLHHCGSTARLTVNARSRRDLLIGR